MRPPPQCTDRQPPTAELAVNPIQINAFLLTRASGCADHRGRATSDL